MSKRKRGRTHVVQGLHELLDGGPGGKRAGLRQVRFRSPDGGPPTMRSTAMQPDKAASLAEHLRAKGMRNVEIVTVSPTYAQDVARLLERPTDLFYREPDPPRATAG
jgi:hypothetical protein